MLAGRQSYTEKRRVHGNRPVSMVINNCRPSGICRLAPDKQPGRPVTVRLENCLAGFLKSNIGTGRLILRELVRLQRLMLGTVRANDALPNGKSRQRYGVKRPL